MNYIQRALDSPDLLDYFSYPQYGEKMHKKVLEALGSQKRHSNLMKRRNSGTDEHLEISEFHQI